MKVTIFIKQNPTTGFWGLFIDHYQILGFPSKDFKVRAAWMVDSREILAKVRHTVVRIAKDAGDMLQKDIV